MAKYPGIYATLVVAAVLWGAASTAGKTQPRNTPPAAALISLPDDIKVVPPAAEIAPEWQAFSGLWSGDAWDGGTPTGLVVEQISKDGRAQVVYIWGDNPNGRIVRGAERVEAKLSDRELIVPRPGNAIATYNLTPDGRLFGRYSYSGGRRYYAILRPADTVAQAAAQSAQRLFEEVKISYTAQQGRDAGRPVILPATFYPVTGGERRPIAIFVVDSPADAPKAPPNRAPATARILLSLSYSVLVPQRRGMTGATGTFSEPRDGTISASEQLSGAVEDLGQAFNYAKRQSFVDPKAIVLIGQRRGGLLSLAYAAKYPGDVKSVVNIAGAWPVPPNWWEKYVPGYDFTTRQYEAAGKSIRFPVLFLRDPTQTGSEDLMMTYTRVYTQAGGKVDGSALKRDDEGVVLRYEEALLNYLMR